jgi:N-acetyltransferase
MTHDSMSRAVDDPRVDPADIRPELAALRPIDLAPIVLDGTLTRLEPLEHAHLEELAAVGLDSAVWHWVTLDVRTREELAGWIEEALADREAGTALPFATIERASGRAVGSTRFLNVDRRNRHVEIGWTWVAPAWQRSGINREAKLLMLGHAFETLGCLRVEFKTDALNDRSRAALLGIGARFEGIFRNHVISQGGRIRHSAWYSVTDGEWPAVRDRLEASLGRGGERG